MTTADFQHALKNTERTYSVFSPSTSVSERDRDRQPPFAMAREVLSPFVGDPNNFLTLTRTQPLRSQILTAVVPDDAMEVGETEDKMDVDEDIFIME